MNINEILHKEELTKEEIIFLLNLTDKDDKQILFNRANEVCSFYHGNEIHLIGVIEFSNYCERDCLYCRLRKSSSVLSRYRMTPEKIIETAHVISNLGISAIVLQSGEDNYYDTDLIAYLIYQIKQNTNAAITLSLGERGFDEYREWKIAGADRYLLKYVTTNQRLYSAYHKNQKLADRLSHLSFLKSLGYQIGSGSIIGLPLQSFEEIADDILMCKTLDLDITEFNTFIPSPNTPYKNKLAGNIDLVLSTMAVARIVLKKVHITAVTELATLDLECTIRGMNAGANIVMLDLTPNPYREQFQIYSNQKCLYDYPINCKECLKKQIEAAGRKIFSSKGDSLKLEEHMKD